MFGTLALFISCGGSPKEEWVSLFDGKTSNGWRAYNGDSFPEKGWKIEDGSFRVLSSKGGHGGGGDIITVNKYENFELSMEWKVSEGANSGIFYLTQEKPEQSIWKSSPEMQVLDDDKHPDAKRGKNGNRKAGSLYDLIPSNPHNPKPVGEWNHIKIKVLNGKITHWMNGVEVVSFEIWTDAWRELVANSKFKDYPDFVNPAKQGHIGLQDHGDDVWYRNIKIREL